MANTLLLSAALSLGMLLAPAVAHATSSNLIIDDAVRFRQLFNSTGGKPSAEQLQRAYLDKGSDGVRIFTPHRIENAGKMAAAIATDRARYANAIDKCMPVVDKLEPKASAIIGQFAALLGETRPAPVYIVFGSANSGGTAKAEGLVLGLEVVCGTASNRSDAEQALLDFIAHETAHVYQYRKGAGFSDTDLLKNALMEGFADFMAELVRGPHYRSDRLRHTYGMAHEAALWQAFEKDMGAGHPTGTWMYYQGKLPDNRPADMGYWIGKRIAQAYYAKAADKQQAMRDLLLVKDPRKILADSGYMAH